MDSQDIFQNLSEQELNAKKNQAGLAVYGLVGYPLGHSFSRAFFNKKFVEEGLDACYLNFELTSIDLLPKLLEEYPNLRGLNITIPYKQAVIPYLDELSDEARAIGAVNVVKVIHTAERTILKGYNSDVIGFTDSIRPLLQPHHQRAIILGTGGASKAIFHGLKQLGLECRYVTRKRPHAVSEDFSEHPLTYSEITPACLSDYTVIVNCTPLGMFPNIDSAPTIPYAALSSNHLLYDLVYNPEITLFMRHGRRYGATIKNGLEMLHRQAIASWNIWNALDS